MADQTRGEAVSSWGDRLRAAARSGAVLDLTNGGSTDPSDAERWEPGRSIPAAELRAVLIDRDLGTDPRGLRLIGARITGHLDLTDASIICALSLQGCAFDNCPSLEGATLPRLSLQKTRVPGIHADQLRVAHDLDCDELWSTNEVRARGAQIGGRCDFNGATLNNPGGIALNLDGAAIEDRLFARRGFSATGEVRALGAHIGGQLALNGATLSNPDHGALALDGIVIDGDSFVGEGFSATGAVSARGARIGGQLNLSGASLSNPGGNALDLDGAIVGHGLFALRGFSADGEVRALRARITGQLALNGAAIHNRRRDALSLDGAVIDGDLFAGEGFIATGAFRAPGAQISGVLVLDGARVSGAKGKVLNLDGAIIGDDILARRLTCEGRFSAVALTAAGYVHLSDSTFTNPRGVALDLTRARIAQSIMMRPRLKGSGRLVTTRASIDGRVAVGAPRGWGLTRWGWRPNWPLLWLLACWLLALGVAAYFPNHFRAADASTASIPFNPFAYATGIAIPAASAASPGNWTGPWELMALMSAVKVAGWLFTALLLTSYTGLLRRN